MNESTITMMHKIGSEPEFAAVCAALLKEGILFEAEDQGVGHDYIITLKGF